MPESDLLGWWGHAPSFMGFPNLANEALNAGTLQVTTSVAEGWFCVMNRLLTYDGHHMDTKGAYRALCARCARAVRALCEKLAVLHHREFGKFRTLEGCH